MKSRAVFFLTAALMLPVFGCGSKQSTNASGTVASAAYTSNGGGSFTSADLAVLQDYLLGRRTDTNGRDFDLNGDGEWNIIDMCLLRRIAGENNTGEEKDMEHFRITAGSTSFTAELADNSSAEAFRGLLENGVLTVKMSDYGDFEKVGSLGTTLPRNDEKIVTEPGDVILYQGTSITIYYDTNTWNFTRLGKIQNVTREQLLEAFGKGDVEITFSLIEA